MHGLDALLLLAVGAGRGLRRRGPEDHGSAPRRALRAQRLQAVVHQRRPRGRDHRVRDARSRSARAGRDRVPRREGHARLQRRQEREEDGHPRLADGGAALQRLRGAHRQSSRGRGRGLQAGHAHARHHTAGHRRPGARHRPGRARRRRGLLERTAAVRPTHRRLPGDPVHAGRYGDGRPRLAADDPLLRAAGGRRHHRQRVRGVDGEVLRRRHRDEGDDRRRADLRGLRLHARVPGRALHARRQDHADLRGHQPDPARGHRQGAAGVTAARRLARFVAGLTLDAIPEPVAGKAALLALDTLGNGLAAAGEDFGRAALDVAEQLGGRPESALLGRAVRVAAANAVLANATLAHGLDFDDTREDAIVHTGCVAVTTALAVGEAAGASGRAMLEALVAAVEVMCRVGLAVPGKFHARHYHPTALAGTFGAAAVAGKLHGSTEDQLVHAFGICGSQAGGIIEYLADGTWTKRLHPGWAAHAGVVATLLAHSGFTGPESVFEGEHGFFRAFAGGFDVERLEELLSSLGTVWELERLTFKAYPCGSIAHPYMDCARRLRELHRLRPDQITDVRCRTAAGPVDRLWEPLAAKQAPRNGYAAKFSLPYLLAVILVKGRAGLAEVEDEAVRDAEVLGVAARASYALAPPIDYPRQLGR